MPLDHQIQETVASIRRRWSVEPTWAMVLGSGLGVIADSIEAATVFEYAELPHFYRSRAAGHAGKLLCGHLAGVPIVVMRGRFHLYEGHSARQAAHPIRVMRALGARNLLLTNAAGGLKPHLRVGDVMAITDQMNLMFRNPLANAGARMRPRHAQHAPGMSAPFSPRLLNASMAVARRDDFALHRGVYAGMLGPTYETRAECRMLRRLGADAVGMSTVPEAIAAVHAGMQVAAFSVITNVCSPDKPNTTSHAGVVEAAGSAADKLGKIARSLVSRHA